MTSRALPTELARSPHSHYDVILIVTSFATELATPTVTDVRTDTLPCLIYKDGHISQTVDSHYHHHHTTTVLWPFFRDHPGEPVPEENFWTLWCKGRRRHTDHPAGCHSIPQSLQTISKITFSLPKKTAYLTPEVAFYWQMHAMHYIVKTDINSKQRKQANIKQDETHNVIPNTQI